jgi:hypothetical protein
MGCFNTIKFLCDKCWMSDSKRAEIEVQTKTGDCSMSEFEYGLAPIADAGGVLGDRVICSTCRTEYEITTLYSRVQLRLTPIV